MSETSGVAVASDITLAHIGMVVLDVPGVAGWEKHLLLSSVEHRGGQVYLGFRWNDDPTPSNTRRGEFAAGQYVDPSTPVRITPARPASPQSPASGEGGGAA